MSLVNPQGLSPVSVAVTETALASLEPKEKESWRDPSAVTEHLRLGRVLS